MIAGLVLAAGAGTRFGADAKLLAELDGRPLLEHAIRAQCSVPELERVVVVLGARATAIVDRCDWFGKAEPIVCPDWADGQSASLRCGVRALAGASRVIVTLGDEPLITPEVIRMFVDQPGGTRATYDGRPGHPVVLGAEQLESIAGLRGDQGARGLLAGGRAIECAGLCSDRDVDTPADLEEMRSEARAIV
ncbi:MAG TPA: nucleotidyltransferase family protein [Solirubrobacteraceae bacterium]|nr:nucleotidyltransferase family protein [Solirubrobacteraceae bacterium]